MATADTPQPATPVKACGFSVSISKVGGIENTHIRCDSTGRKLQVIRIPSVTRLAEPAARDITEEEADMIEALAIRCITDPPPAALFDLVYGYFEK